MHPVKRLSGALKQEAASCVEPNSEQVRSKVTEQMFSAFATKKNRTVFKIEKKITTLIQFCEMTNFGTSAACNYVTSLASRVETNDLTYA